MEKKQGLIISSVKDYIKLPTERFSNRKPIWHHIYFNIAMKSSSTKTTDLVKSIDKQLKSILTKDIRKIDDVNIRNAAFLQLIAA